MIPFLCCAECVCWNYTTSNIKFKYGSRTQSSSTATAISIYCRTTAIAIWMIAFAMRVPTISCYAQYFRWDICHLSSHDYMHYVYKYIYLAIHNTSITDTIWTRRCCWKSKTQFSNFIIAQNGSWLLSLCCCTQLFKEAGAYRSHIRAYTDIYTVTRYSLIPTPHPPSCISLSPPLDSCQSLHSNWSASLFHRHYSFRAALLYRHYNHHRHRHRRAILSLSLCLCLHPAAASSAPRSVQHLALCVT